MGWDGLGGASTCAAGASAGGCFVRAARRGRLLKGRAPAAVGRAVRVLVGGARGRARSGRGEER